MGSKNGLVQVASPYAVEETVRRLEARFGEKGLQVFAVVDHSGEAEKVGLKMRPTKVVIFGSPRAGTPLMVAAPELSDRSAAEGAGGRGCGGEGLGHV